ncbi:hypothetical protein ACFL27_16170 [candidate division CSSED10-310 bacterium]|uniref:SRPBCC family protein n=1 Tax=candidate division CSSED10-310 bacterium TaxID=2855610 RepID=A0ABV6YZU9_UNCC1
MLTNFFQVQSTLTASSEEIWSRVFTMEGVNAELSPWMRMTYPREAEQFDQAGSSPGQCLFRSIILFLRIIPIDLYYLSFISIKAPTHFHEQSHSITIREWTHKRTLQSEGGNCRLKDTIHYSFRVPGVGRLFRPVFYALFKHRHRYLRRAFGHVGHPEDTEI